MRPYIRSALAPLLVLLSACGAFAQTVQTVRVVLPQQASAVMRNIAGVLARQVAQRCDASVVAEGEAPLKVELAIAPGIGTEGFRIEDRPGGGVKIIGNDSRGLLYGVGKLLRTSRYDRGGFSAGVWRGTSIPEKPVRGIYFATHFHNFYHDAPVGEVQRYVEDVGLWGLNSLIVWYDMHHFMGFDSPEAVDFRHRLQAICGAARRVGLDVGFACVANEGYANSPEPLRADVKGMRGTAGGDNLGIGGTHHPENQGKLFFFNGTKCGQVLSGRTALPPGSWHQVVLVRQLQRISVYLDGRRDPEICGQAEIGYPASCGQLFLGGRNDGFAPLEGKLDEVSIFSRALSAAEIAAHYASSQPQPQANVQNDSAAIPERNDSDLSSGPGVAEDEQRAVSQESVEYLRAMRKNAPFGTNGFDLAALRAGMGSRREPSMKGVKFLQVKIGDIPCEWVLAPGADPDLRLLYLHGGGFVSGSGGFYLTLAAHLSAAAKCAALLPNYRLAPEHRFPAGLEDCIRAHEWLIANGPAGPAPATATFIAGDSAGGNLTLATLLALRDRGRPLPAGGIALSPTTDLTLSSESLRTVNDPIISARTMPVFRDHYLGKADPRNPLASPVFGDYRGLPPLLIQVGEHEMLRDDSVRVAEKARADGIPVKLEVWPGMFHVFQSHEPLLPEGREAIDHAADFMRSSLPRR